MAKKYNGGIKTPTSISPQLAAPSDDRFIVETLADLQTLEYAYPEIEVKVESETYSDGTVKTFIWNGADQSVLTNWIEKNKYINDNIQALSSGVQYAIPQSGNTPANEPAPTVNGNYPVTVENATYTNFGNTVIGSLENKRIEINVSGNQDVFTVIETTLEEKDATPTLGSTKSVTSEGVKNYVDVNSSKNTASSSLSRASIVINGANITLGDGFIYTTFKDGTVKNLNHSNTVYTLASGESLVHNKTSNTISKKATTSIAIDDAILFRYDGAEGVNEGLLFQQYLNERLTVQESTLSSFLASDVKAVYTRSDIYADHEYYKIKAGELRITLRDGSQISRTIAETTYNPVASGEAIVYRISNGATNPIKINLVDIVENDDIILNVYDGTSKWYGGWLHDYILKSRIGLKVDGFFHRGSIKLSGNILTLGAGNYYFVGAKGLIYNATIASTTNYTLDDANGRYLTFRLLNKTFGYIEQKINQEDINPYNTVVIGRNDSVAGFHGILKDAINDSRIANGHFIAPKANFTTWFWASDTHSDDVSNEADASKKNIYGNFTRQYQDIVNLVNKSDTEFYLHTGDLNETFQDVNQARAISTLQSVKETEKGLTKPKYQVAGNHDTSSTVWTTNIIQTFYNNVVDNFINDTKTQNFDNREDLGYYYAKRGNLHIIVLNTNDRDTGRTGAYYDIDATQRAWFISTLNSIPDYSHILIASHITLRFDETAYGGSSDIRELTLQASTITELENAMITYLTTNKNSRVVGWFGGHAHESNRKQVAISTSGGQSELNYLTLYRSSYSQQSHIYQRSNLSYAICSYDNIAKLLKITGYGFQDSYEIQY